VTLVTYSGSLGKVLQAAGQLAGQGIDAEVIDLRSLWPLDMSTVRTRVERTYPVMIVDEGWRSGSLAAEISASIREGCIFDLDAPVARACSVEVPMPYAKQLEVVALPQVEGIVKAVREML
jgi:pyruvate dehydrogenase E1 component beta subunit